MSEPIPEGQGPSEGVEVDYEVTYDPESQTAGIGIQGHGVTVVIHIKVPEGLGHVDLMTSAFVRAVPELLEGILEKVEADRG